jgi:inhibitor of KinA sporulation pathway (predicted exonuclease)
MIRSINSMTVRQLIVFDLEFTAWEGSLERQWLGPGEFKEVVQIGAVRLDDRACLAESFNYLVRPRFNPRLSEYFENLTGISNDRLAAEGVAFETACRRFLEFSAGCAIASFGRDDWVLEENIRLHGLRDFPALPHFLNLRDWFDAQGFETSRLHSCDIGPLLGVPFEGRAHDALCDARSIAAGMNVLLKRGAKLW